MKIAFIATDNREAGRTYSETAPHFSTGSDSLVKGFAAMPDVELHVVSCTQQPMRSPEKLADNIWFHSLHVPKIGWLRTFYQGCIRATRNQLREIQPDVVHGVGTEREGAISAVFSGFPNVVAIQGNMAELARLHRARIGSYGWLAARLENFTLPRAGGVICNSLYTERLVRPRARKTWVIYPGLREMFVDPPPPAGPRDCALVIAGIISSRKRQMELLDVAEELHRRGLKFEFRFVGFMNAPGEPYTRSFLERIKPMEAAGYARYLGAPSNDGMVRCFDTAAGMVHFPTEEAFGSVVAEGLARELKFFGARVGGIVEITEGVPGAELFASDDWTGLTNAIARWIENGCPPPAGAAALMRERYHPEVFARQHLKVYHEALNTCS
ncbi:MAG: glycosyltransferase family 4 protein [Verrucomicrobiia bacterium]